MSGLLVIGAGGHGRVVADTAASLGRWHSIALLDDRFRELTESGPWKVIGPTVASDVWFTDFEAVVPAVGDGATRLRFLAAFDSLGYDAPPIVHPAAQVSAYSDLGAGTVAFAGAVVNVGARVGRACILNTGSIVEHDCILGDGVHLSPNAVVAGGVEIDFCAWVGVGACVKEGLRIGARARVGAGAAVVRDVHDDATVVGVPAREMGSNSQK